MARANRNLMSNEWEPICYPVKGVKLTDLLPDNFNVIPSDRKQAIIAEINGQQEVMALQSLTYSLVPNNLIREVVEQEIPNHQLSVGYTHTGDFTIKVILNDQIVVKNEILSKSVVINNSYTGKSKLTVQGTVLKKHISEGVKVSFYRKICDNGLMGWVDQFMSYDEYLEWLLSPGAQKEKYKVAVESRTITTENIDEGSFSGSFSHSGLKEEFLREYLSKALKQFTAQRPSLSTIAYNMLADRQVTIDDAKHIMKTIGVNKQLINSAINRLELESDILETSPNLWLVYNAANFSLFNTSNSQTYQERYIKDESVFHQIVQLALN